MRQTLSRRDSKSHLKISTKIWQIPTCYCNWKPGPTFSFLLSPLTRFLTRLRNLILANLQRAPIFLQVLKKTLIYCRLYCGFFNESLISYKFPSILKRANVTLVFKKGYHGSKGNYRPFSILSVMSKIFEKLLCK